MIKCCYIVEFLLILSQAKRLALAFCLWWFQRAVNVKQSETAHVCVCVVEKQTQKTPFSLDLLKNTWTYTQSQHLKMQRSCSPVTPSSSDEGKNSYAKQLFVPPEKTKSDWVAHTQDTLGSPITRCTHYFWGNSLFPFERTDTPPSFPPNQFVFPKNSLIPSLKYISLQVHRGRKRGRVLY